MGQKVNPRIFRIGTVRTWPSRWFVRDHEYATLVKQDVDIRKYIKRTFKDAGVSRVEIERSPNTVNINVFTAKPGLIIGRGGQGAEKAKQHIKRRFFKKDTNVNFRIQEVANPMTNAEIIVQTIAADIEKRIPFRRVLRQSLGRIERAGGNVKGARILVKGRLNGAEIARSEKVAFGSIPLHTLRANVDYSRGVARTIYGAIGIKVWIYGGEVFDGEKKKR
jgi:small subunit ribosomal protein S3